MLLKINRRTFYYVADLRQKPRFGSKNPQPTPSLLNRVAVVIRMKESSFELNTILDCLGDSFVDKSFWHRCLSVLAMIASAECSSSECHFTARRI